MSTFATNEAVTAHSNRQVAGPEKAAPLQLEANAKLVGVGADALALQRLQRMANRSPRALQLRQQAETIASSPAAMNLQRLQRMANNSPRVLQLKQQTETIASDAPKMTGMPGPLKAGIEVLSGMDVSDVRVHRNSDRPAQLNALAFAQGNDIHLGPAQEQHLPHEAWHVVQQRQGRVRATMQLAGVGINDDAGLEREADVMGARAASQNEVAAAGLSESMQLAAPRQTMQLTSAATPGTVLQAVWVPELHQVDRYRWDTVIDGKQWYYDASTNMYYYIVVDSAALTFSGLADAFGVGLEAEEDRPGMTARVLDQAYYDLPYGHYFCAADEENLKPFDVKANMQPLADPVSRLCLDYLHLERKGALEDAISLELGNSAAKIQGELSWHKFSAAFNAHRDSTHFQSNANFYGSGAALYSVDHDEYMVSPLEASKLTLRKGLRQALWAAMGLEIEDLDSTNKLQSADSVFEPQPATKIGEMEVRFTRRVTADLRHDCLGMVGRFYHLIASLTPEGFEAIVRGGMQDTFKRALDEKQKGIGQKPDKGHLNLAAEMANSAMLTEEKLRAYCVATVRRWHALLKSRVLVVFDAAGFEGVYGKTPTFEDATPANLMTGPANGSEEEPGLPASTYVLINAEAPDSIITLAHELAHVIGFNPTGVEASGHFGTSSKYKDAEAEYGPKLLFDAYYFEVLVRNMLEI